MKKIFSISVIAILLISNFSFTPTQAAGAYMYLSKDTGSYYIGQNFNVSIMVNTGGEDTDAADAIVYYDPTYLEVVDSLPAIPGTQILPGSIYDVYPGNDVDPASGRVRLTGFSMFNPYNSGSGSGFFGIIVFKGKQPIPNTSVLMEYNPGDSHDCNLAQTGTSLDILTSVSGGNYEILPDTTAPYITNLNPANGSVGVNPNTNISFHIKDDETSVDINSVTVIVNGITYTLSGVNKFVYSGNEKDYYIVVDPPTFDYEKLIPVHIEGADIYGNRVTLDASFTTGQPPQNLPPVFQHISDKTIYAGSTLTFPVIATDPNSGDRLTITMNNAPTGATLTEVSNGRSVFNWPTSLADLGDYSVTFTVVDNGTPSLSDTEGVAIKVVEKIIPPPPEPESCPVCPPCGQRTACSDNRDNDGDGKIDYPADLQCKDYYDVDELVLNLSNTGIVKIINDVKMALVNSSVGQFVKNNFLRMASPDGNAFMLLSPISANFYPDQLFNINILEGTDNSETDAVDVVLHYNPEDFEVLDALPAVAGIQIKPGSLYEAYPGNSVDPVAGEIKLTAFSIMSTYNSGVGTGILATINFKAKRLVNGSPVTFDFIAGSTTDSNIALHETSEDILTSVINGLYNVVPDARPPYITNFSPPDKSTNRLPNSNITFHLKDDETSVDIDSVEIRVEDQLFRSNQSPAFAFSGNPKDYQISVDPVNFAYEQIVDVYVDAKDTQGNALTYYSWFQIMPEPVNRPPVLSNISNKTAYSGTTLTFSVSASDPDSADILSYSLENAPVGATITKISNNQAFFEWAVPLDATGAYYPTIKVNDNGSPQMSDDQIVTINMQVTPVGPTPPASECPPCPICPQCLDNYDNDGDSFIDYPNDPGCLSAEDNDETDPAILPQCSDGLDNDNDNLIDYPNDPGCVSASDNDEFNLEMITQCSDGIDNDDDSFIDYPSDPGCISASDNDETDVLPEEIIFACSDGQDNDADGLIDYPADPGCFSSSDNDEFDEKEEKEVAEQINQIAEQISLITSSSYENTVDLVKSIIKSTVQNPEVEKITTDYLVPILIALALWNFLALLAFAKWRREKIIGIVYDSMTKKPINLAVVQLLRSEDDKLIDEKVTNAQGRFGIKAGDGEYFIKVAKNKYVFPSLTLFGQKEDDNYKNLYFGEILEVKVNSGRIHLNIPLDANDEQTSIDHHEISAAFARKFLGIISFSALFLAMAAVIIIPSLVILILLLLHVILVFLLRRLIKGRS